MGEANDPDLGKIRELIRAGRIELSPDVRESLKTMDLRNPDFTITKAELRSSWDKDDRNNGGFEIRWQTVSAGCGSLTVYADKDGNLKCDNEVMGPNFLKTVFAKLVDSMELTSCPGSWAATPEPQE